MNNIISFFLFFFLPFVYVLLKVCCLGCSVCMFCYVTPLFICQTGLLLFIVAHVMDDNITQSARVKPCNFIEVCQENWITRAVLFNAAKHCKLKVCAVPVHSLQSYSGRGCKCFGLMSGGLSSSFCFSAKMLGVMPHFTAIPLHGVATTLQFELTLQIGRNWMCTSKSISLTYLAYTVNEKWAVLERSICNAAQFFTLLN